VGDALICLAHIYLSLAMQPLFTAFASVAFFKLLIFCVIKMKCTAIIIQARNNANGGQNTMEILLWQIVMLHVRFYFALVGSFLAFFYAIVSTAQSTF
jgi:transmembrane E3 ubiquitin-protein ligase